MGVSVCSSLSEREFFGHDSLHCYMLLSLFLAELAASIPRTEIVGKGDYFRFGMRDSLAIEASFLQVMIFPFFCYWFLPILNVELLLLEC